MASAIALYFALAKTSPEKLERSIWARTAYVCRYGSQPLDQVLALSAYHVRLFQEALSDIVACENGGKPGARSGTT